TLAGWVGGACWWLDALYERLCANVFASDHLFADDTPVPVLDPGRGRTKTGRLWVYARDPTPTCAMCSSAWSMDIQPIGSTNCCRGNGRPPPSRAEGMCNLSTLTFGGALQGNARGFDLMGQIANQDTPTECANYIANSGDRHQSRSCSNWR